MLSKCHILNAKVAWPADTGDAGLINSAWDGIGKLWVGKFDEPDANEIQANKIIKNIEDLGNKTLTDRGPENYSFSQSICIHKCNLFN